MFVESLVNYINTKTSLGVTLTASTQDSVRLVIAPSSREAFSLDMDRPRNFSFQLVSMNANQFVAYNQLDRISELLDGLSYSDIQDDHFDLIVLEETTSPNFVETNDRKQHVYSSIYNAEIIKK